MFDYYYGMEAEQFAFYRIPRTLIKDERFKGLSSDAKILYGLMLDRMSLSMRNGWLDEYNRVYIYYTVEEVMEDLGCSRPTVAKIIAELDSKKGIGLIEKKRQGQGKPDCIYVKNFAVLETETEKLEENVEKVEEETQKTFCKNTNGNSMPVSEVKNFDFKKLKNFTTRSQKNELQEVKNFNVKKLKNLTSRSKEFELQEVKNFYPNKTDINNTNINNININKTEKSNNNPINQSNHLISPSERKEKIDMIDRYERLIAKNIQYDSWMQYSDLGEKELVEELYQLICDVVCVERESVRVNGVDYPHRLVKAQFLKINYSHIEYTLACLKATTSRINNIRAYLITTLYNAVSSMNCYYQQEVQHDLYGDDG